MKNTLPTIFVILTLTLLTECNVRKKTLVEEKTVIHYDPQEGVTYYDTVEVNAVQDSGYLFNCENATLRNLVDSIASVTSLDSIQYLIRYNFSIDFDSSGKVNSVYYNPQCGPFCVKVDSLIKNLAPLNPPFFLSSYRHLGVYENSVHLSIRFRNHKSSIALYYPNAIVPVKEE